MVMSLIFDGDVPTVDNQFLLIYGMVWDDCIFVSLHNFAPFSVIIWTCAGAADQVS